MKNLIFYTTMMAFVLLISCDSSVKGEKDKAEIKIVKTETYSLKFEESKVSWVRIIDYKLLNKRVKLFGAYVDTQLENVHLETNGDLKVLKGNLVLTDDIPSSAEIEIDLTLTRFYSDVEEMFFESESYSPAKLSISKFEQDSAYIKQYIATANLTMNGKTAEITFPTSILKNDSDMIFSGTYIMHVSDWPLLKQPKPENVNHDEISLGFDFVFGDVVVANDTILIEK